MSKCSIPLGLLLYPECFARCDYLVVTGYKIPNAKETLKELERWRERKYIELLREYGIQERTCLADILKHVVRIVEPGDTFRPIELFYLSNWTKGKVEEAIQNLERFELLRVFPYNELPPEFKEVGKWIGKESGKFIIPTIKVNLADLNVTSYETDFPEISYISEGEKIKERGELVEKVDVRGKSDKEKFRTLVQKKREYIHRSKKYTHREGLKLAEEFAEKIKNIPYVNSAFIVGSVAREEDVCNDVDVTVETKYCPSRENCDIHPHAKPIDLFCYTAEEISEMKRRRAFILSATIPLFG